MWHGLEPGSEHSIEPSERTILECGGCGERLVLLGLEEDWYTEGRTAFKCGECGGQILRVIPSGLLLAPVA
jgi:hypothetical protein